MRRGLGGHALAAVVLGAVACACGTGGAATTGASPVAAGSSAPSLAPSGPRPTMTFPADVSHIRDFTPLPPGRYFIDADVDPARTLRVEYTVPAGWTSWIGAYHDDPRPTHPAHDAAISIVMITNLVRHGCTDHVPVSPPVGPSVDDLADALVAMPPFTVAAAPRDVELAGFTGRYVELEVPDLDSPNNNPFTSCTNGNLKSWIGPPLSYAFYGYHTPGQREGFWILDVGGRRLVIQAIWVADLLPEARAELDAVLDSIAILP